MFYCGFHVFFSSAVTVANHSNEWLISIRMCVWKMQNICERNECATAAVLNTEVSTSNKRFNLLIAARFNSRRDYYQWMRSISHVFSTRINIPRTNIEFHGWHRLCVINFQYAYDILTDTTSIRHLLHIRACCVFRWLINYIIPNISTTANRLQFAQHSTQSICLREHEYDEYDESSD